MSWTEGVSTPQRLLCASCWAIWDLSSSGTEPALPGASTLAGVHRLWLHPGKMGEVAFPQVEERRGHRSAVSSVGGCYIKERRRLGRGSGGAQGRM